MAPTDQIVTITTVESGRTMAMDLRNEKNRIAKTVITTRGYECTQILFHRRVDIGTEHRKPCEIDLRPVRENLSGNDPNIIEDRKTFRTSRLLCLQVKRDKHLRRFFIIRYERPVIEIPGSDTLLDRFNFLIACLLYTSPSPRDS